MMTTVTEQPTVQQRIDANRSRLEQARMGLQRLKDLKSRPEIGPLQVQKIDAIIPKVETLITNLEQRILTLNRALIGDEIDEVVSELQGLVDTGAS